LQFAPSNAPLVASPWQRLGLLDTVITSTLTPPKGSAMRIVKNFEALFVATLGLACAANYVLDKQENAAPAPAVASVAAPLALNTQVVVVSAKRLSADQKKQSLLDESKAAMAAGSAASKM
jgi:hypothetical protein